MDGDEDGLEVGGEGLVELVVAGGGLAVVLHAVEDAFHRAVPGPAVEPPADGDPLAVALRQVPPQDSRAAHPRQGVDERVVVDRHVAAPARRRMRDPHEPVKRDAIPRRTHTTIITQNLNSINTP